MIENDIEDTSNCFEEIKQKIKGTLNQFTDTEKAVILIGDTGDGKSTLLNLIAGNELIATNQIQGKPLPFKKIVLQVLNPNLLKEFQIGHESISKTTVPNKWVDLEGTTFWDCPGFNDTKGLVQDILNGFNIKKIFDVSKKVKCVIAVSQERIQGRADQFISLLSKISKLFEDINQMKESFCLILTKTNLQNEQQLRDFFLKNFLPEQKSSLNERSKILIEHLASQKGQLSIFPSPKQLGPMNRDIGELIRQKILFTKQIIKPKVNIVVAENSLVVLEKYAQKINEDINNQCQILNKNLQNLVRQFIQNTSTFDETKVKLRRIESDIEIITSSKCSKDFLINFQKIIQYYKVKEEVFQKLSYLFDFLDFIGSVKSNVKYYTSDWTNKFSTKKMIETLLKEPEVWAQKDIFLNIKANLIGTQKIEQLIREKGSKIKVVNIFVYETLYLDSDLNQPGMSISILAKNWTITGDRKIFLNGRNAQNHQNSAKSFNGTDESGRGIDGENGLPGNVGQTGGSFFGKVIEGGRINFSEKLTIDVRGGNGGNGQDGGNGSKGRDGENGKIQLVEQKVDSYLSAREEYDWGKKETTEKFNKVWKTIGTFNGQMLETYRSIGQKGSCGGNAGKGGKGGQKGLSGKVVIIPNQFHQKVQILNIDGIPGKDGKVGKPGSGGKNGDSFQGQHIQESIGTTFRDKGRVKIGQNNQESTHASTPSTIGSTLTSTTVGTTTLIVTQQVASKAVFGVCCFGLPLLAQVALSMGSSYLSSGWKVRPHKIEGQKFGRTGFIPNQLNTSGLIQNTLPFDISNQYMRQLEKTFAQH